MCLSVTVRASSGWSSVRTDNFYLAGEVTEAELRTVADRLEQFRDVFTQLFPQFKTTGSRSQANVLIFRDAESYRPFKPIRADGTVDENVAGYFLAGENANYITLSKKGGKTDPFHTIFHEYIHFLLKSRNGKAELPSWISEGLAQYFETLQVIDGGRVTLGTAPQNRLELLRRSELIAPGELLSARRTALHIGANMQRSMFYAQSWLLVHYLLHNGSGKPGDRLEQFLRSIGQGDDPSKGLKQIYGLEAEQLSATLRSYVQNQSLPVTVEPLAATRSVKRETAFTPVSPALIQAYLGDLLYYMDRFDEAEPLLRKAVAADSKLMLANASLGLLMIRREKWDEAGRLLETAVRDSSADYFVHFNYAYALSRASSPGGMVRRFPPAVFAKMRESLERSIALEPGFADSYHVLAFIFLVNGTELPLGVGLLEKGLSLKPGDENFEILLAKILVRLERYQEARVYAEKLSQKANDPQVRADAADVLSSISQYLKAGLQITATPSARGVSWSPALIFLKRSWVSKADLETIDRDRENTNRNVILERPRPREQRRIGTIDRIECTAGSIIYNVRSDGKRVRLYGERFDDLRMAVLVTGQHSFRIDCGVRLASDRAVLAFVPDDKRGFDRPRLASVTFVPLNFELRTPEQMSAARQVIIENDLLQRVTGTTNVFENTAGGDEARWASIKLGLRAVGPGEVRVAGTLESIECGGGGYTAIAAVDGKQMRLNAEADLMPSWFSVESTQVSLACGSTPRRSNVLFTYQVSETGSLKLRALEFLPSNFPTATLSERAR